MTSVRSFAEILRDNADLEPAERARFASIIQAESMRLTRLIDEIRDLSFLEDRDPADEAAPSDPEAILGNAIEVALAPFAERNVALREARGAGNVRVLVEPGRLSQVFINLIANAVLHNDKERIEIAVTSRLTAAGAYEVTIEDNGPGVPPEIRGRIFEPFFRGSTAGSSGLGLAISARIIDSYGGSLDVGDGSTGGARFTLHLPLAPAGGETTRSAAAQ
jgi:signal transduction histidine kinase